MKCQNCGYHNPSDKNYCLKCGSPLEKSPIINYKKNATNNNPDGSRFSTKEKIIIGLCIIGVLMLIVSAVIPPDLDLSGLANSNNDTPTENPELITDTVVEKIDTQISVASVGIHENDKIIVNARVTDANNYPVNSGIASITINEVKYSGNVQNGNANIILPQSEVNSHTETLLYEGDETYNPSKTTVNLQIAKTDTIIDYVTIENKIKATLKSVKDEKINDAIITIVSPNNTVTEKKTDGNGEIIFDADLKPGKNTFKLTYDGNELYNSCEKIIELEQNKKDTKIDAQYDENSDIVKAKLMDKDNQAIRDASLVISEDNKDKVEKTGYEGIVEIPLNEGSNKIAIRFDGDSNYNPSSTTINVIIEENDTDINDTDTNDTANNDTLNNNTQTNNTETNITNATAQNNTTAITPIVNDTQNITNTTIKDNQTVENDTPDEVNSTQNNSSTNETPKTNTILKHEIISENSTMEINLITNDNRKISNESIIIKLDNGKEITEKTDENGTVMIDLEDLSGIKFIELIYSGNDEYNNTTEEVQINNVEI